MGKKRGRKRRSKKRRSKKRLPERPVPTTVAGKSIDDYRERFKTAPIGRWSQAVGTFGGIMDEIWVFKPDHTGKVKYFGPFGVPQGEMHFEWKEVADFTIACKITQSSYPYVIGEPGQWETIHYDFKMRATDCGYLIGMYEVSADGTFGKGFWYSMEPLANSDWW